MAFQFLTKSVQFLTKSVANIAHEQLEAAYINVHNVRIAPDKFNICDGTSKEALQTAQLFRTTLQAANVSLELLEKCGVATKVGTYRDEDENFTPSDTMTRLSTF